MKVLSVRQPWAWALIFGGKDIENRSWKTKYRGPVAIHTSQGMTKKEYSEFLDYVAEMSELENLPLMNVPSFTELDRGKIIGVVDLVDVVEISDSPWFFGPYGWIITNPRPWTPLKRKGSLGLREYTGPFQITDNHTDNNTLSLAYGRHVASGNLGSSIQT